MTKLLTAITVTLASALQAQAPSPITQPATQPATAAQLWQATAQHDAQTLGELVRVVREGCVHEVQAARDRADRSRVAAMMPSLRVNGRLGTRANWAQHTTTSQSYSEGDSWMVGATLSFPFDHLIFGPDETQNAHEVAQLQALERNRIEELIAAFFERKRLLIENTLSVSTPVRLARIAELEALLDVWTDGLFSRLASYSPGLYSLASPMVARVVGMHDEGHADDAREGQDREGQDREGQDREGQDREGQDREGQDGREPEQPSRQQEWADQDQRQSDQQQSDQQQDERGAARTSRHRARAQRRRHAQHVANPYVA